MGFGSINFGMMEAVVVHETEPAAYKVSERFTMLNLSRFTAFALLALASPAASQILVTVPMQYQGRWAQNCDVGWSISITEREVGGIKIKGLVENLPGHILITQAGSQISLFPQLGSNGRKIMMSMTPKGEAEETIGIMNLCAPVPAPLLKE